MRRENELQEYSLIYEVMKSIFEIEGTPGRSIHNRRQGCVITATSYFICCVRKGTFLKDFLVLLGPFLREVGNQRKKNS